MLNPYEDFPEHTTIGDTSRKSYQYRLSGFRADNIWFDVQSNSLMALAQWYLKFRDRIDRRGVKLEESTWHKSTKKTVEIFEKMVK